MWHSRPYDGAMDSTLPIARPWTPPDLDIESSPRSDYFSDPFRPSPARTSDASTDSNARCDTPTEDHHRSRPKPRERASEPLSYMPTTPLNYGDTQGSGALRYPYTPDSSRLVRRSTELMSSPPSWDQFSEHSSSPVQDALSSCIAHFENLIHSQQPSEDQMEYVVGQFEAMTAYLSAPNSQTRTTDEHLFADADNNPEGQGLGISDTDNVHLASFDYNAKDAHEAYIIEVGQYITGVKRYIEDLKMRFDEVKTLNSIQLEVINDLRDQMRVVQHEMRSSLEMREDDSLLMVKEGSKTALLIEGEDSRPSSSRKSQKEFGLDSWETLVEEREETPFPRSTRLEKIPEVKTPALISDDRSTPRRRVITIIRKPERRSFWKSFGEALDAFEGLMHDY